MFFFNIVDTPQKTISWDKDADRLILYADIMGFSFRVNRDNHKKLKRDLIKFKKEWEKQSSILRKDDRLRSVQFSDSIMVVVNGIDEEMFNLITKAAICLMQTALSLGFPIKGVISQGKFTYDRNNELYFGLPLVEAYNLHDEIHYYGIVVHHSAEKTVKLYADATRPYIKTAINLKKGRTSHYHLLWHLLDKKLSKANISNLANDWLDKIEEGVSGEPRIYVDNTREILTKDHNQWLTTVETYILK